MNNTTPPKKKKNGCMIAIFVIIGFFAIMISIAFIKDALMSPEERQARDEARAKEQKISDSINKQNDAYFAMNSKFSSAIVDAEMMLQKSLKDPKSYERVKVDKGLTKDSLIVIDITYRATNSFGAYLQDTKQFTYTLDGAFVKAN
ncbi:hypothetical protein HX088_11275 [Empedobacter sp. 225-1]|uniref:hypothetical protein n=1 Tax=Empedobacter sp. 225-1 TaxID=2746725 RepID=UPI0025778409|nr:hypothetical protein [Empedobacter sp. 225-1]MDM1523847.1 hypothetical protein [Empedobacter sp. 225-1]